MDDVCSRDANIDQLRVMTADDVTSTWHEGWGGDVNVSRKDAGAIIIVHTPSSSQYFVSISRTYWFNVLPRLCHDAMHTGPDMVCYIWCSWDERLDRSLTHAGCYFPCLWSPYGIGRPYIFHPVSSSFFFFSSPNLSSRRLDVYHTSAHGVVLV